MGMSDETPKKQLPADFKFVINEDGSVTFENLPPELMHLALALNPDSVLACDVPEDTPGGAEASPEEKGQEDGGGGSKPT